MVNGKEREREREARVYLLSQQLAKNISLQVPERLQCLSIQKVEGDIEETLLSILPTDQFFVLLLEAVGNSNDSIQQYQ